MLLSDTCVRSSVQNQGLATGPVWYTPSMQRRTIFIFLFFTAETPILQRLDYNNWLNSSKLTYR